MKRLIMLFLLFISSSAFAGDVSIERFVDALIRLKQTEIAQLNNALDLLREGSLTGQEKFEQIGQPAFSAVEQALTEEGFTLMSLLRFEEKNAEAINQWLYDNPDSAGTINTLDSEKEALLAEYDQLNKPTTTASAD